MAYNPYLNNPYLQPYYQPIIQQQQPVVQQPVVQQPIQQSQTNVIWVNSETEARNYPIAPGNTVMLMDNDNPVAYKKSADLSGRALPLEIYDLVKREEKMEQEENHQINLEEYLTRKEFNTYATTIDKRLSEITSTDEDDDYDETDDEEVKPVRRRRGKRNA